MVVGNLAAMTHGAAVVVPSEVFDPQTTLSTIANEKCTALHAVPTMFIALLEQDNFADFDLTTLRTGITGAAPCPLEVMRQVVTAMHMREVVTAYGMTEASPLTCMTAPDAPIERRVDSVGKVVPHQEIKIVDPHNGKIAPRNIPGEICFRGYHIMAGYDDDLTATAQAIDSRGWLHSGDLGTMDDDGYIRITGRIKEMVIRGGENIYPREIEEFLHTLSTIREVAVVGVPDQKFGEEIVACVTLVNHQAHPQEPPTIDEFRAACKGQIAHYKIPRYWLILDEFPMTASGKIQKFKLQELAIRRLNLAPPDSQSA